MKKLFGAVLLLIPVIILPGCQKKLNEASGTDFLLDTVMDIKVYGYGSENDLNIAIGEAFKRGAQLEKTMSATDKDSELSYVNANAFYEPIQVSDDLFYVFEEALKYAELSEGAFDPSLGKLIDLWGIGTDKAKVPEDGEIAPLTKLHNYKNIKLDKDKKTVSYMVDDFTVNFGAIAKGYIGEEMKRVLTDEYNIDSALLYLGGNIITIGENASKEKSWTVGIADPRDPDSAIAKVAVSDKCVVTSGAYQRYFEKDGRIYHHILDGSTGYPAETGLISTTIICSDSTVADALSTATYAMGEEKALKLIESLDGIEAVLVRSDYSVIKTSGLTDEILTIIND